MKPIVWIYADAAMDEHCPNCDSPPNEYCRRSDGHIRAIPCLARMPRDDPAIQQANEQIRALPAPALHYDQSTGIRRFE